MLRSARRPTINVQVTKKSLIKRRAYDLLCRRSDFAHNRRSGNFIDGDTMSVLTHTFVSSEVVLQVAHTGGTPAYSDRSWFRGRRSNDRSHAERPSLEGFFLGVPAQFLRSMKTKAFDWLLTREFWMTEVASEKAYFMRKRLTHRLNSQLTDII